MDFQNTQSFAQECDRNDPLAAYRQRFLLPQHQGEDVIYLTGNSLGLQPKSTRDAINHELDDWARLGVEGHFHAAKPWMPYHEFLTEKTARLVGAKPEEVVCMNQLTVNIHLLMVSFYRPRGMRFKIICEQKAFPSDQYALESQVKFHGYDADEAIVEVGPREGEHNVRHEDILAAIEKHKDELALVFIGGVNYYSGQVFDMAGITKAAHAVGAYAGFDLAHAAGNIELNLHDWDVDFACWCSYKYLNSGPGSVAGAFIHERHANSGVVRFAGWWGHDKATRFKMEKGFNPIPTAEGWQLSNAPVFAMAAHNAALEIFDEVGMHRLREKTLKLSGYLEFIIDEISKQHDNCLEIITPRKWNERGCQVSVIARGYGRTLFEELMKNGVYPDWREPNVIRMAPVPLYNSFMDVFLFGQKLGAAMKK